MIAYLDETTSHDPEHGFLADFARKLEKHASAARLQLAEIAALPDGPRVYRMMRNNGQLPASVAAVLKQLDPHLFAKLEGRSAP